MTLKIVPLIMISCCKGNDLCKRSQALGGEMIELYECW